MYAWSFLAYIAAQGLNLDGPSLTNMQTIEALVTGAVAHTCIEPVGHRNAASQPSAHPFSAYFFNAFLSIC